MFVKVFQVENFGCETADSDANNLSDALKQFDLSPKFLRFCIDITNTDFGRIVWKGTNNRVASWPKNLEFSGNLTGHGKCQDSFQHDYNFTFSEQYLLHHVSHLFHS